MTLLQRSIAEAIGTFWLVFGGCGAAVLACGVPNTGIGYVGVSLAFGLTVLTMAYAIGHISGCHLNPAVTLGQVAGGRFPAKEAPAYIIAQVIGGIIAAAVLYIIASPDLSAGIGAFATNGWSDMANANGLNAFGGKVFGMGSAFLIERVLQGRFSPRAPAGFAPIAIGLCLTLIHLIGIPATNTSVNPARSTAVAVFVGGMALKQLWLFWVAPILGGVIGGVAYKVLAEKKCCCGDKCCCEKKEEA